MTKSTVFAKISAANERYYETIENNRKILEEYDFAVFDIETTNLNASIGRILCASIKPLGEAPTTIIAGRKDRDAVNQIREELSHYDYVITYYGTGFDIPFVNTRLLINGDDPLTAFRHVDLYYTARTHLKLHSNRLAVVAESLFGDTTKTRVLGPIWDDAASGDSKAMDYIVEHCEEDVNELERVFWKLANFRNLGAAPLKGAYL